MKLHDIWNGDYGAGLDLIEQYVPRALRLTRNVIDNARAQIARGTLSATNREKIETCLRNHDAPDAANIYVPTPASVEAIGADMKPAEGLDAATVQRLKAEAKPLHKEHDRLHALLGEADSDEKRAEIATEIMKRVIPSLDRIYAQLRGEIPLDTPKTEPNNSGEARLRKLQSLRSQRSAKRKKLATAQGEETDTLKAAITTLDAEIADLENPE